MLSKAHSTCAVAPTSAMLARICVAHTTWQRSHVKTTTDTILPTHPPIHSAHNHPQPPHRNATCNDDAPQAPEPKTIRTQQQHSTHRSKLVCGADTGELEGVDLEWLAGARRLLTPQLVHQVRVHGHQRHALVFKRGFQAPAATPINVNTPTPTPTYITTSQP